jgi:HK97 family phage portal protein
MFNLKFWRKQPELKRGLVSQATGSQTKPEWSYWDAEKAITEGFKQSVPVFACIKKRYEAICSLPFVVEVKQGDEWIPEPNHPLQRLLDNPNPLMDGSALKRQMLCHLDLAGNAIWHKVRGGAGSLPLELWPINPHPLKINVFSDGTIQSYELCQPLRRFEPQDICHFKTTNPSSLYIGQAPLQSAGKAVDVDTSAQDWQKISMQNRGVPDFMVSYDDMLTEDQIQQVQDLLRQRTGAGSAREPLVTSKAKIQQLSLSPVEMDFMHTRRFSREEVCSVYGVPSALIAEMGAVNLANSETARRLFWLDTVIPLADEIIDSINHCLTPEFGDPSVIRVTYDTSNIPALQENYGDKITNAQKLWSMGVPLATINKRLELGFDEAELPNADKGYISSGIIPTDFDFADDQPVSDEIKRLIKAAEAKK